MWLLRLLAVILVVAIGADLRHYRQPQLPGFFLAAVPLRNRLCADRLCADDH